MWLNRMVRPNRRVRLNKLVRLNFRVRLNRRVRFNQRVRLNQRMQLNRRVRLIAEKAQGKTKNYLLLFELTILTLKFSAITRGFKQNNKLHLSVFEYSTSALSMTSFEIKRRKFFAGFLNGK